MKPHPTMQNCFLGVGCVEEEVELDLSLLQQTQSEEVEI
jgi:hypothetical protein